MGEKKEEKGNIGGVGITVIAVEFGDPYRFLLPSRCLESRLEPGPLIQGILRVIDHARSGLVVQHTIIGRVQPQIRVKENDPIFLRGLLYRVISGCNKCAK